MKRLERRRSRSSVDDLRRELRDADQERFYLQGAVNTAADEWLSRERRRPVARRVKKVTTVAFSATVLLLLGGIVWARLNISRPTNGVQPVNPVTVVPAVVDVQTVRRIDSPVRQAIPVRKRLASTTAPKTGIRRSGLSAVSTRRVPPTKRAVVPRPLSPGEFGRTAPR